ncbi:MAG: hypothetical protein KA535_03370 [Azonexus sp.]|nr:hypothetical protein [Azonexus sp.]
MSTKPTIIPALPGQRAIVSFSKNDPGNVKSPLIHWFIADVIAWEYSLRNDEYESNLRPLVLICNDDNEYLATRYIESNGLVHSFANELYSSVEDYLFDIGVLFDCTPIFDPPLDTLPAQYRKKEAA